MGFKRFDRELARKRKHRSIRKKITGSSERPRLVVFRSNKNIYAQLVDDSQQRTLTGISSLNKELQSEIQKAKSKTEVAFIVGKAIAEKAKKMKIEKVVFDRAGYLYHGRVKALAEGAREGGLKF
ncbi:MAG: 50S ribosomal protein L18 [candidate division KSB1 bacterium]|nr:50S ribosomal protein L18 [candidate division KSB1 bacterium]